MVRPPKKKGKGETMKTLIDIAHNTHNNRLGVINWNRVGAHTTQCTYMVNLWRTWNFNVNMSMWVQKMKIRRTPEHHPIRYDKGVIWTGGLLINNIVKTSFWFRTSVFLAMYPKRNTYSSMTFLTRRNTFSYGYSAIE